MSHRRAANGARKSLRPERRRQVLRRDGRCCRYCGQTIAEDEPITVDHLYPVEAGGTDHPGNLVVACAGCNRRKGGRLPSELHEIGMRLR